MTPVGDVALHQLFLIDESLFSRLVMSDSVSFEGVGLVGSLHPVDIISTLSQYCAVITVHMTKVPNASFILYLGSSPWNVRVLRSDLGVKRLLADRLDALGDARVVSIIHDFKVFEFHFFFF